MNVLTSLFSSGVPRPQNRDALATLTRPAKRERDFGVGYGSSSGYAKTTRYTTSWAAPRFRFG